MSVLIKDMKMPKYCVNCRFHKSLYCTLTNICTNTAQWCPLIEIPPHGRLIDADVLIEFIEDRYEITWEPDCYEGGIKDACCDILEKIDAMPTIIEAEE